MTQGSARIIRFGIMCKSMHFEQWEANAIKILLDHNQIKCNLLIVDKRSSTDRDINNNKIKMIIRDLRSKNYLWKRYMFLNRKLFQASKLVDLTTIFTKTTKIKCKISKKGKFSEYFIDSDISEIKKHNLDFILRFGFGIIRGDILNTAKYGVWSYHHDDEVKYRGGPPCFWEIYNNDNITGSILQRLTNKLDSGIVLRKGFLKTSCSYVRNRDQMYFESSRWPIQVCTDILNGNINYLDSHPSATKAQIHFTPTNIQFIIFFLKSNLKKIKNFLSDKAFSNYWNIGVANAPIHSFLKENNHSSVKWFPNLPKDRFFADPFAQVDGNKLHIFFEEYSFNDHKGKISYTCYENGQFSIPQTIINEAFHLSYPYLFKDKENIYMVPESFEANRVILYKATHFPLKWEMEHILIDNFAGLDNTIFHYNGSWWMFTSNEYDGRHYNLFLFYTDDIFDEWKPHLQNPIKTDIRSARSAGTPFVYNGDLYRPSMDYSAKGQGSITINKVITITKEIYQEVSYNEVQPYKNSLFPDKIHTLCKTGEYTLIDGCKETFKFTNINYYNRNLTPVFRKLMRNFHKK